MGSSQWKTWTKILLKKSGRKKITGQVEDEKRNEINWVNERVNENINKEEERYIRMKNFRKKENKTKEWMKWIKVRKIRLKKKRRQKWKKENVRNVNIILLTFSIPKKKV